MRHLETEIKHTLLRISIIPIAILALLTFAWDTANWYFNISGRNDEVRVQISQIFSNLIDTEERRLDALAQLPFPKLKGSPKEQNEFYTEFYKTLHVESGIPTFYIYDEKANLLLRQTGSPEIKQFPLGFFQRMNAATENILEFSEDIKGRPALLLGRAMRAEGRIYGYMLIIISESCFIHNELLPTTRWAIADSYGYTPITTLPQATSTVTQKLALPPENLFGFTLIAGQHFVVSHQEINDGDFTVYAFTPVDRELRLSVSGIIIFLLVLSYLLPAIFLRASKIAQRNAKGITELMDATSYLRAGNFSHTIELKTGNELEVIADNYNEIAVRMEEYRQKIREGFRDKVQSELLCLEAKSHPQFLFEQLKKLRPYLSEDPTRAAELLDILSWMHHYSSSTTESEIQLESELTYLAYYLKLQKENHGEKVTCTENIDSDAYGIYVPKIFLQPVFDFLIDHCSDEIGKIRLSLQIEHKGMQLLCTLKGIGKGIEEKDFQTLQWLLSASNRQDPEQYRELYQVHRRIQLLHGAGYGISVFTENAATTFLIHFPAREDEISTKS